jgi:hypothetical protein
MPQVFSCARENPQGLPSSIYNPYGRNSRWPLYWAKIASTGRVGRTDRMRCTTSGYSQPSTCRPAFNHGCRSPMASTTPTITSTTERAASQTGRTGAHTTCARKTPTGRAPRNDWTRQCQHPVTVQRGSRELLS